MGPAPRTLSHGRRVPAAASALRASRRRSGMGGESLTRRLYVAAVRWRRTSVTETIPRRQRWLVPVLAILRRSPLISPSPIPPQRWRSRTRPHRCRRDGVLRQAGRPDTGRRGAPQVRRDNGRCDGQLASVGDQVVLVAATGSTSPWRESSRSRACCVSGLAR